MKIDLKEFEDKHPLNQFSRTPSLMRSINNIFSFYRCACSHQSITTIYSSSLATRLQILTVRVLLAKDGIGSVIQFTYKSLNVLCTDSLRPQGIIHQLSRIEFPCTWCITGCTLIIPLRLAHAAIKSLSKWLESSYKADKDNSTFSSSNSFKQIFMILFN